jgi:hypothetical protein
MCLAARAEQRERMRRIGVLMSSAADDPEAPTRVTVIRDPRVPAASGGFAAIQTAAPGLGVEATPIGVRDADEIERGVSSFARGGGRTAA